MAGFDKFPYILTQRRLTLSLPSHLGRHDSITPGQFQTPIHVLSIQNVPIRKDWYLYRLLHRCNGLPVRNPSSLTLHLPRSAVTSEDLGAGGFHHFRVGQGALEIGEDSKFRGDRDGEIHVQGSDCVGSEEHAVMNLLRRLMSSQSSWRKAP